MSLQQTNQYTVPESTKCIAQAVFPNGTLCLRVFELLGTMFQDEHFSDLFPNKGQPSESPFRLALVTILQFIENLTDRAAADAVRSRIDWKYLLCLEIDDQGFNFSVLSEFRDRFIKGGKERRLFDHLLQLLREKSFVKARGLQRTDSTHVLAAVKNLSRLEIIGETLRATLNALAELAPTWVQSHIPIDWRESYGTRLNVTLLPENEKKREDIAVKIGSDGYRLLDLIYSERTPTWFLEVSAVEVLRKVWLFNFYRIDGIVEFRKKDNIPTASTNIVSPYDIEAHYGRKRSTTWIGYKVHLTESDSKIFHGSSCCTWSLT